MNAVGSSEKRFEGCLLTKRNAKILIKLHNESANPFLFICSPVVLLTNKSTKPYRNPKLSGIRDSIVIRTVFVAIILLFWINLLTG